LKRDQRDRMDWSREHREGSSLRIMMPLHVGMHVGVIRGDLVSLYL
jgi:hypothetical protein